MNKSPLTRTVTVRNPQGLHARPADLLVRTASKYESTILIGKDGELVDCKSILSLLTLGAGQGTVLSISADGQDASDAIESIAQLFDAGFDDKNEMQGLEPAVDS
ncbi:MAG: HPr family phosphocarrier protein [Rubripirellula sp.]